MVKPETCNGFCLPWPPRWCRIGRANSYQWPLAPARWSGQGRNHHWSGNPCRALEFPGVAGQAVHLWKPGAGSGPGRIVVINYATGENIHGVQSYSGFATRMPGWLAIDPAGIYLDGTAGGGGHSSQIAQRLTTGRLVSLDQDPDAIQAAGKALEGLPATLVQTNFCNARTALQQLGIDGINGALLDLGVSSHQLMTQAVGFPIGRMRRWICA